MSGKLSRLSHSSRALIARFFYDEKGTQFKDFVHMYLLALVLIAVSTWQLATSGFFTEVVSSHAPGVWADGAVAMLPGLAFLVIAMVLTPRHQLPHILGQLVPYILGFICITVSIVILAERGFFRGVLSSIWAHARQAATPALAAMMLLGLLFLIVPTVLLDRPEKTQAQKELQRVRLRIYGALAGFILGVGALGSLLNWGLHWHPNMTTLAAGMVIVAGAPLWWVWSESDRKALTTLRDDLQSRKVGASLNDSNLEGVDLSDTNLAGASLKRVHLRLANLGRANLGGAWLNHANLENASLERVDLNWASLNHANLKGANLCAANLEGAYMWGTNLEGANLSGANLERAKPREANLKGSLLEDTNLEEAWLWCANLKGAAITVEQLAQAKSLGGATLPDGTKLSKDNWPAEFEEWRKEQEEQESDA